MRVARKLSNIYLHIYVLLKFGNLCNVISITNAVHLIVAWNLMYFVNFSYSIPGKKWEMGKYPLLQ